MATSEKSSIENVFSSTATSEKACSKIEIPSHLKTKTAKQVSDKYIEATLVGLEAWIQGGAKGDVTWGFFVFEKL
jgi:hypothetical protein